ncbi:MAG: NUDIX hydrolase [Deltaproteobacteria bacterium]|nr:NUDIX hydrolase [Deltaproteobacteria bacterium]
MSEERKWPGPLAIGIELIQDVTLLSGPGEGFLRRHRHRVKTLLDDGTRTDVFVVDFIDRDPHRRNAAVVALYAPAERPDDALVWLRRQVRYAQSRVSGHPLCTELVAGIIESPEDPLGCARREVLEEVGLDLPETSFSHLGPPFFVLPGTLTEEIHLIAARATQAQLLSASERCPPGDGSPFEEGAQPVILTLGQALELAASSRPADPSQVWIADAKTELGLRRLRDRLSSTR